MTEANTKIVCPLCGPDGQMEYKKLTISHGKETHVWICDSCPGILFEYQDRKDTEALSAFLNKDEDLPRKFGFLHDDSYKFITNKVGEETGLEIIWLPSQKGQPIQPVEAFAEEYRWWNAITGRVDTYYVIDVESGRRGALYTEEFPYTDSEDSFDKEDAIEDGLGNSDEEFEKLKKLAAKVASRFSGCDVKIGCKTGPFSRHELCVFVPFGTIGADLVGDIDTLVHE